MRTAHRLGGSFPLLALLVATEVHAGSPASATYFEGTNGDFRLYECTTTLTFTVTLDGLLPAEDAVLTVYGFDVDEEQGELNHVYVNGHFAGPMSGVGGVWNSSNFELDPSWLVEGENAIDYEIDLNEMGWCSEVDWMQLLIDGGAGSKARIVKTRVNEWSVADEHVGLDTDITVEAFESGTYILEANLIDPDDNNLDSQVQTFSMTAGETGPQSFVFQYPLSAPTGTYVIKASLFHAETWLQDAYHPYAFFHEEGVGVELPPDDEGESDDDDEDDSEDDSDDDDDSEDDEDGSDCGDDDSEDDEDDSDEGDDDSEDDEDDSDDGDDDSEGDEDDSDEENDASEDDEDDSDEENEASEDEDEGHSGTLGSGQVSSGLDDSGVAMSVRSRGCAQADPSLLLAFAAFGLLSLRRRRRQEARRLR